MASRISMHLSNTSRTSCVHHTALLQQSVCSIQRCCRFSPWIPFNMRKGAATAVSHGLWVNIPDYNAPTHTQLVNAHKRNTKHVHFSKPNCRANLILVGLSLFSLLLTLKLYLSNYR